MIAITLSKIQKEFQDNWLSTPVMFGSQEFSPSDERWIIVDVLPTYSTNFGMTTNLIENSLMYVDCYGRNQTQASILADEISSFIQNRDVSGVFTGPYSIQRQGPVVSQSGTYGNYRIKLSFDLTIYCSGLIPNIPPPLPVPIPYNCSTSMSCATSWPCSS